MNETLPRAATDDPPKLARAVCLADLVGDLVSDAEEAVKAAAEGRPRGPITALPELDAVLGDYLAPGLHGITGDPGSGKTALALQIAARCGYPAIYVSAEQSPIQLFRRHIARVTNTDVKSVRNAPPHKIRDLAATGAAAAPKLCLLDATQRPATAEHLVALGNVQLERFDARHVLFVIDALQPWAKGVSIGQEYDVIQDGIRKLLEVASCLKAPVLVLSHRNRAADKSKETITAAKGTADFEHMAESVLHLSWESGGAKGPIPTERNVDLFIAKNRHGASGFKLPIRFNSSTQEIQGSQW